MININLFKVSYPFYKVFSSKTEIKVTDDKSKIKTFIRLTVEKIFCFEKIWGRTSIT